MKPTLKFTIAILAINALLFFTTSAPERGRSERDSRARSRSRDSIDSSRVRSHSESSASRSRGRSRAIARSRGSHERGRKRATSFHEEKPTSHPTKREIARGRERARGRATRRNIRRVPAERTTKRDRGRGRGRERTRHIDVAPKPTPIEKKSIIWEKSISAIEKFLDKISSEQNLKPQIITWRDNIKPVIAKISVDEYTTYDPVWAQAIKHFTEKDTKKAYKDLITAAVFDDSVSYYKSRLDWMRTNKTNDLAQVIEKYDSTILQTFFEWEKTIPAIEEYQKAISNTEALQTQIAYWLYYIKPVIAKIKESEYSTYDKVWMQAIKTFMDKDTKKQHKKLIKKSLFDNKVPYYGSRMGWLGQNQKNKYSLVIEKYDSTILNASIKWEKVFEEIAEYQYQIAETFSMTKQLKIWNENISPTLKKLDPNERKQYIKIWTQFVKYLIKRDNSKLYEHEISSFLFDESNSFYAAAIEELKGGSDHSFANVVRQYDPTLLHARKEVRGYGDAIQAGQQQAAF